MTELYLQIGTKLKIKETGWPILHFWKKMNEMNN